MINKVLVYNVNVITMNENKDIIENAVIYIEDNKIKDLGTIDIKKKYENLENIKIIDGNDGIAMPGMINCHCHGAMVAFRSLADDHKDRLKKYLFPLEQKLVDKDLVYKGSKYAIAEMLLGGVTTFCDMYYFEDEVAKAVSEMEIRAVLCETVVDFKSPDSDKPYGGLDYAIDFIEKWKGNNLIMPGIAPHAIYTNSEKSLIKAYEISKKYNVPLTMHVAEMEYELEDILKKTGLTVVAYLDKLGVLDENFISAHSILVNDDDIKILKEKNVKVVHNIGANSKGAKGIMPIMKMMENNINIALGSDGPMSGNTIDILTQMPQVAKIHKLFSNDRSVLKAREVMEMATIGGAKALGIFNKVGSIEVGKYGDIVIMETKSVNMQPIYDYYSTIVYAANPSNVNTVIVDGKIIVNNKELVNQDFEEIRNGIINLKRKINHVASTL